MVIGVSTSQIFLLNSGSEFMMQIWLRYTFSLLFWSKQGNWFGKLFRPSLYVHIEPSFANKQPADISIVNTESILRQFWANFSVKCFQNVQRVWNLDKKSSRNQQNQLDVDPNLNLQLANAGWINLSNPRNLIIEVFLFESTWIKEQAIKS